MPKSLPLCWQAFLIIILYCRWQIFFLINMKCITPSLFPLPHRSFPFQPSIPSRCPQYYRPASSVYRFHLCRYVQCPPWPPSPSALQLSLFSPSHWDLCGICGRGRLYKLEVSVRSGLCWNGKGREIRWILTSFFFFFLSARPITY